MLSRQVSAAGTATAANERRRRLEGRGADGIAGFYVAATGQIESAEFKGEDNLFCRYSFAHGPDWKIMQGMDHGFSQVALKGSSSDASVVWNLPIDATFKSTNPQGWPRLVVSVYCQDLLGRYVVRGYGSTLIPTVPGRYIRYIRCFTPLASTMLQSFLGWLTGSTPEFYDSKIVATGDGREVTRVQAGGLVRVQLQVVSRGLAAHGYATGGPPDALDLGDAAAAEGLSGGVLPVGSGSGRLGLPSAAPPSVSSAAAGAATSAELIDATRRLLSTTGAVLEASRRSSTLGAAPLPPARPAQASAFGVGDRAGPRSYSSAAAAVAGPGAARDWAAAPDAPGGVPAYEQQQQAQAWQQAQVWQQQQAQEQEQQQRLRPSSRSHEAQEFAYPPTAGGAAAAMAEGGEGRRPHHGRRGEAAPLIPESSAAPSGTPAGDYYGAPSGGWGEGPPPPHRRDASPLRPVERRSGW